MVSFIIKKLPILKIRKDFGKVKLYDSEISKVVTRRFLDVWVKPSQRILCYSKDVWAVEGDRNKLLINQKIK